MKSRDLARGLAPPLARDRLLPHRFVARQPGGRGEREAISMPATDAVQRAQAGDGTGDADFALLQVVEARRPACPPAASAARRSCGPCWGARRPRSARCALASARRRHPARTAAPAGNIRGLPGPALATQPGSPATIRQKMRFARPRRLKARISSLTQRDFAGLRRTDDDLEVPTARAPRVSVSPRLVAVASSSRSRKIGRNRAGTGPECGDSVPTRRFGNAIGLEALVQPATPISRRYGCS